MTQGNLQLLAEGRRNNLNALRLGLALLVVLSHCFPLTGFPNGEPLLRWTHGQQTFGGLAVDLFFFISGFLITASWLKSKSMNDYLRRRVLRIYPAYIVALLFSFVAGSIFAQHRLDPFQALLFGFKDIVSLDYTSSSGEFVFPNNPVSNQANGSLWTIHQEFYCYLLVAAIGLFGLFRYRALILGLTGLTLQYYLWAVTHGVDTEHLDVRFLTFFLCGMSAWLWRDKVQLRPGLVFGSLAILFLAVLSQRLFRAATPLVAAYLVLWAGFARPLRSCAWCDKTDLSYGTYLFAFPVQQTLVALGVRNPWLLLLLAIPLILGLAWLSWNLVEQRCLALKNRDFSDRDPAAVLVPPVAKGAYPLLTEIPKYRVIRGSN